jgi:hypothetical protein
VIYFASKILALISGLLIGSDLIISKDTTIRINKTLRDFLTLSNIRKTFVFAAVLAIAGMLGWIIYSVWKDSQTSSNFNIVWVPIFMAGFIIGLTLQWFVMHLVLRLSGRSLGSSIAFSSVCLGILTIIIFIITVKSSIMPLTLGLCYGVAILEFSIGITKFLTWFLTTDPNPDPGRNPRILARIGLLFLIITGIIELFH